MNLKGIESWNEQQQQSARDFYNGISVSVCNELELGKTSLAQHDIKLDDMTPFKEQHQRIPLHQYEDIKKHLQEMLEIRAIHRSTSLLASPMLLVHKKDGWPVVLY